MDLLLKCVDPEQLGRGCDTTSLKQLPMILHHVRVVDKADSNGMCNLPKVKIVLY